MATVRIKGMSCQHCVASTKEALEKIPETKDVQVDLDRGEATFTGDAPPDKVKDAISKIGFEVVEYKQ